MNNEESTLKSWATGKLAKKDLDLHQRAAEVRVNKPVKENGYWWDWAPVFLLAGVYLVAAWLFGRRKYD